MISDIRWRRRDEARSPAFPPPMPSETAKTRSWRERWWEPEGGRGVGPSTPEAKVMRESSLRGLREPLCERAAQWRWREGTGGFFR
jgi:hypothetical protein